MKIIQQISKSSVIQFAVKLQNPQIHQDLHKKKTFFNHDPAIKSNCQGQILYQLHLIFLNIKNSNYNKRSRKQEK